MNLYKGNFPQISLLATKLRTIVNVIASFQFLVKIAQYRVSVDTNCSENTE